MLNKANVKGKHLTEFDRSFIESALNNGYLLNEIGKQLGKDPRTISKEIKRNRIFRESSSEFKGGCINRRKCSKKHICSDSCNQLCKKCINLNCMRKCNDFKSAVCHKLSKFPHVCNGCESKLTCKLDKYNYSAKHAEIDYKQRLVTSREGINITPAKLKALDALVSPLVNNGQPIAHIYSNHKEEIECSERTLYSYIDQGFLSIKNIDLRRKVTYKVRKAGKTRKPSPHRISRSYEDFITYTTANPELDILEMDTVIGRKGGKAFLTLYFRSCKMMVILLLDKCTQECVIKAIDKIYDMIGLDKFRSCFPIILSDNGTEFINAEALEYDSNGTQRTRVFYCDPYSSYQKGQLEKNHEFIRYVLPKGRSFDHLTQNKVTRLANHINSTSRSSLNGNTPFKLGELLLDKELLITLSLEEIAADDVYLREELVDPTYLRKTLLDAIRE